MTISETDLEVKLKLKLHVTSSVVGETAWTLITPGQSLNVLEVMRLPPFLLTDFANSAGLDLVLSARRASSGGHTLCLDYLLLLPLDGWRSYSGLYPLPQNWRLVDNGALNLVTTFNGANNELITHIPTGHPFLLAPHVANAFFFGWMDDTGEAVVMASIQVKAWCTPRRRLP